MADKKISQLTGATTPLGGTEEVPLVQSSTTKKVTVENLTAGRSVAAASFQANGRIVYGATAIYDVPGPTGNNTGLSFSGNLYLPVDGTGTLTNGVVSIGSSSYRYNDIHIAGNVIPGTAAKGINFTANTPAAGMTSQLLNWYEEGTWTPSVISSSGTITTVGTCTGQYTRIGRQITLSMDLRITNNGTGAGYLKVTGIPFNMGATLYGAGVGSEINVTGKMLQLSGISTTEIAITNYDGTYPGATGFRANLVWTYFV
jgi:hypothetical protein